MEENEKLEELVSHSVREFAVTRERIDAELKAERARRVEEAKTALALVLAKAYAGGLKISRIKELYGTRDHRTVRALIDHGTELLARLGGEAEPESKAATFGVEIRGGELWVTTVDGAVCVFDVLEIEGGVILDTDFPIFPDGPEGEKAPVVDALDGLFIPGEPGTAMDDKIIAAVEQALSQ